MKRQFALAVIATAAMAITLSHPCTVHKADRYKLCSVHRWDPYTDYAIVNIKTGEVLVDRVHDRTYAIDDVDDYNKFLPYARKQVQAWEAKDGKMIFHILPPRKRANSNAYT
jgi:hypothetical protein